MYSVGGKDPPTECEWWCRLLFVRHYGPTRSVGRPADKECGGEISRPVLFLLDFSPIEREGSRRRRPPRANKT